MLRRPAQPRSPRYQPLPSMHAHRVVPASQQRRDVVGLVLQALVVARPAGSEELVAHAPAVQVQLVEAVARDVGARPRDAPFSLNSRRSIGDRARSSSRPPADPARSSSPSSRRARGGPSPTRPARSRPRLGRFRPRSRPASDTAGPTAAAGPRRGAGSIRRSHPVPESHTRFGRLAGRRSLRATRT